MSVKWVGYAKLKSKLIWAVEHEVTIAQLECLGLPVRVINGLEEAFKIIFVEDLLCFTQQEIKSIPNFGVMAWQQIIDALSKVHLIEKYEEQFIEKTFDKTYLIGGRNYVLPEGVRSFEME